MTARDSPAALVEAADTAALTDLFGDADPDVRLRAAMRLGELRHGRAAAALVARFGLEREFAVRETLTWAALRMPDAALPFVRQALHSWRWLARLQATHTLSKVADPEDGRRLMPLVGDPVDAVAARAYGAVAECGNPVVLPALAAELSRGSAAHRNSLTVAMSRFGARAVPVLVHALRRGDMPQVRSHAADILAYLGSPAADGAQAALAAAVRDADATVRLAALNALGQLVLTAAWQVVAGHVASPEPRLSLLARRLMERRPDEWMLRAAPQGDGQVEPTDDRPDERDRSAGPARSGWPTADLALVTCEGGAFVDELAPKLALQVEISRPQYLARADVPAHVLAGVHADALRLARAGGRSDALASRIAAGAVEQFVHGHVLLEQVSVADPGVIVKDLLFGTGVHIAHFVRLDPLTGRA